jgi:plastocyanin
MKPLRTILLLPLMLALVAAIAACGGDDAPTDEEYFQRMDAVDKEVDSEFENVNCGEESTAADCATGFGDAIGSAETKYDGVTPSDDAKDEHDELVAAIGELRENIEGAEFQDDDPPDAFFEIFDTTRVDSAFCALQDLTDSKNIEADVGCDAGGEEGPDPATLEPVETTEVLMQDFAFDPPHIQVTAGDTVTWEQGSDPAPHNASADDESFSFDPIDEEGGTGEATFDEAGVFPYSCDVHPEMRGQVTVVE